MTQLNRLTEFGKRHKLLCGVVAVLFIGISFVVASDRFSGGGDDMLDLPDELILSSHLSLYRVDLESKAIQKIVVQCEDHITILSHDFSADGVLALACDVYKEDAVSGKKTLTGMILLASPLDDNEDKYVVDKRFLVAEPGVSENTQVSHLDWSPDGKHIAYVNCNDPISHLCILELANAETQRFPVGQFRVQNVGGPGPRWDDASQRIILSDNNQAVYLYDQVTKTIEKTKLHGASAQWGLDKGEVILFREGFYYRIDLKTGTETEKARMPRVKGDPSPCVVVFRKQRVMAWISGTTNLWELLRGHVREDWYLNVSPVRKGAKAISIPILGANGAIVMRAGEDSGDSKTKPSEKSNRVK